MGKLDKAGYFTDPHEGVQYLNQKGEFSEVDTVGAYLDSGGFLMTQLTHPAFGVNLATCEVSEIVK